MTGKPNLPPGASGRPPETSKSLENNQFIQPPKRKRGRPRKNPISETQSDFSDSTVNMYESLDDDDPGEIANQVLKRQKVKDKKPPPIIIRNLKPTDIEKILENSNVKGINKRLTKNGTKLFVSTNNDFKLLKTHLDAKRAQYLTYTLDEDKIMRFVLYGLIDCDVNDIRSCIAESLKVDPIDIKKMKIRKPLYHGHTNYIVYFKRISGITLQHIMQVKGILGYHVFWAKYKKSAGPTQCHNCQEFYHTASNGKLPPRCVRCSGKHKSSECKLIDPK